VIIPAQITREVVIPKEKEEAEKETAESEQSEGMIPDEESITVEELTQEMPCTIYKINDYEAVLRVTHKLDYRFRYIIELNVMDFNVRIITRLIATKTVVERDSFFYTVKFDEMSESANNVLKKYIYEHL